MNNQNGRNEAKIDCNDFTEPFQIKAVKNEPCEISILTCYQEQNEEQLDANNPNPEDSDRSEFSNYLSNKCDTVQIKNEDDDDIFHENIEIYQEQNEEKLDAKNLLYLNPKASGDSQFFDNSPTYTQYTAGIKNEVDIFYEDIKSETETCHEKPSRLCEVCYQSFEGKTDFLKFKSYKSECSCQKQNESLNHNIVGQDMTLDVKPFSLDLNTDWRLKPLEVQDESISGDEVTKEQEEQDSSTVPPMLPESLKKNDRKIKRKFCSEPLKNIVSFSQMGKFEIHERSHTGEKPFHCKVCPKSFSQRVHLNVHEKNHTGEKPFQCEICSTFFTKKSSLKVHQRSHTGERPYKCKICSNTFTTSDMLKVHGRVHTGEIPFCCKICTKSFSRRYNLKIHERSHTGERPFHCEICSKSFTTSGILKDHKRCHTGEMPFHCKICSKSFRQGSNLKEHERTHSGERPFHCEICPKSFNSSGNLKNHKRCHTGEMPFHCKICSKSFTQGSNLKEHERTHSGEKPFRCQICSKSFGRVHDLNVHERIHTGEKPFNCDICSKSFRSASNLNVHKRTHTGENPFCCKICSKSFRKVVNSRIHERSHTGEK